MSNALLKSCRTKEILYKKFKVSPTPQNKSNYCKYKNKLTSLLREAERTYYGTRFDQAKSDIKETWKIIKEALNKNNSNAVLPDSFNHNNIVIDNKKQICNKFNEYFVNVGPNLDKKIERLKSSHRDFLTKGVSESFFLCPVTDCEIIDLVNLCKNKTSCGWDSISMTVVKKTINNIASPLAHLMNVFY